MEKVKFFVLGIFAGALGAFVLLSSTPPSALKGPLAKFQQFAGESPAESKEPANLLFPYRYVDKAPVTITEYADFHSSYSRLAAASLKKILTRYPTSVRINFRHLPSPPSSPGSGAFLTHEASVCAHEQGKFWAFHDIVFDLPEPPKETDLEPIAKKAGAEIVHFQECLKSGKYRDYLNQEIAAAKEENIFGPPTFIIRTSGEYRSSGTFVQDQFEQLVDSILNPKRFQESQPSAAPAAPSAQAGCGTAPSPAAGQPSRPGAEKAPAPAPAKPVSFNDLEGRPSKGPKNAPVTLVEFSDFHCPFCKRVGPTLQKLEENYSKKIRRVWRHFPLSFHRGADRTHEASECAHEQGKFWEYHDRLFENQSALTGEDKMLVELAEAVGLKKKKFEECLASGKFKPAVNNDITAGEAAGVRGTPAFFINGQLVSGAQPYESFEKIVQNESAKKSP